MSSFEYKWVAYENMHSHASKMAVPATYKRRNNKNNEMVSIFQFLKAFAER